MIVQETRQEAFILEHQLSGKELRLREPFGDVIAQLRRFIHHIRSDGKTGLGAETLFAHVISITFSLPPRMFSQVVHFRGALERAGIEHTYLEENKIFIDFREHPDDREQRVQAEAIETVDE